ncbi:1-phosphofructokinase family hexose kinase [Gordonia sp. HY002]|uniref:1-phosphofructokinase family hexose kinase n=1 Tax=Gordonia zhenghanii TaxID=2911516 RepID=UPI001EEFFC60|nr:1-phosphofructokinase family hexose kinase [Gordonia zhenghanii]MCF8569640.1 1-phosphofructokinase family hexose kinase [Gordonia zhenghanii]MCF8602839.1 1-phosphofructokinase family hexose kinase [Gordonia zhenghanii]
MILTVTANPSIDRTIELDGPLHPGGVHRTRSVGDQPGGKGVNVARAVTAAGMDAIALIPARPNDPFVGHLDRVGLPRAAVDIAGDVRVNLTLAAPDGVTTKVNAPGASIDDDEAATLTATVVELAAGADWLALCGSLPPGLPPSWYVDLVTRLAGSGVRVAVDTSGTPLTLVASARPDLLKPNAEELAELTGADAAALEATAADGDPSSAADASARLAAETGGVVLTTLGGSGALLATGDGVWFATAPTVRVRSTVGAGDSSLAGYLIAEQRGGDEAARLRHAVSYGSAAAALPGTTPPTPDLVDETAVSVTRLS